MKMPRRIVPVLAALVAFSGMATKAEGQEGWIRGVVVAERGEPLPDARVTIEEGGWRTTSDTQGAFLIGPLPAGRYLVRAGLLGYAPRARSVLVTARDTADVRFELLPGAYELEPIVVIAGRRTQSLDDVPQAVSVVTEAELERLQAATPGNALRETPGVWIFRQGTATQAVPNIRGSGFSTLALLDGVRTEFAQRIPDGSYRALEIIRGPGAVQYGSNAMQGVLNIISRDIDRFPARFEAGGEVAGRYNYADTERSGHTYLWAANDRFHIRGGVARNAVGELRAEDFGRLNGSSWNDWDGNLRAGVRLADDHVVRLSFNYTERESGIYQQAKLNPSIQPRIQFDVKPLGALRLDYEARRLASWVQRLRLYGYGQHQETERDLTVERSTTIARTRTARSSDDYILGLQASAPVKVAGGANLTYGVEYRYGESTRADTVYTTTVATGSTSAAVPSLTPDEQGNALAGFLLADLTPVRRLHLSLGARLERNKVTRDGPSNPPAPFTTAQLTVDKAFNSFVWSAGAIYRITESFGLAGFVGTSYQPPGVGDLADVNVPSNVSGVATVPNPDLEPQKSVTVEFGPRYTSGRLRASVVGYWSDFTDRFVTLPVPGDSIDVPGVGRLPTQRRENIGEARIRGIEAEFSARLGATFALFGNGTYTRGDDSRTDEPLSYIPPLNGLLGLRWNPAASWWLESTVNLVDRLTRHAPGDETNVFFARDPGCGSPTTNTNLSPLCPANPALPGFEVPGYAVVNLRGGVRVWTAGRRSLDLTAQVNNLADRYYRTPFSVVPTEPGRSFLVSSRLSF